MDPDAYMQYVIHNVESSSVQLVVLNTTNAPTQTTHLPDKK
jgi:hypothetical protein